MNRLHAHIGKLICHIIVCITDRVGIFLADNQRVPGAEMIFMWMIASLARSSTAIFENVTSEYPRSNSRMMPSVPFVYPVQNRWS